MINKGFYFKQDCIGFVIQDENKARNWAFNLGLTWTPYYNLDIYQYFQKALEPSDQCLKSFRPNYIEKVKFFSKNDNLFYLNLIYFYFKGLLQSRLVDPQFIFTEYNNMKKEAINFSIFEYEIPNL